MAAPSPNLIHRWDDQIHRGPETCHTELYSQLPHHLPLLLDPTPALQTHGPAQPVHPVGCQGVQEGESAIIDTTGTEFSEPSFYVSVIYLSIHLKTIFFYGFCTVVHSDGVITCFLSRPFFPTDPIFILLWQIISSFPLMGGIGVLSS